MGFVAAQEHQLKDGAAVIIRTAAEKDAEAILDHARSVFHTSEFLLTEADEFTMTPEAERKWISDCLAAPGKLILVVEIKGTIVGMLNFENGHRRRASHSGTLGMSVRDGFRGRGIGELILKTLLEWATASPAIERVELAVFDGNQPAQALYRKLGFREEGRKVRGIRLGSGRYLDEIWMCRTVKPADSVREAAPTSIHPLKKIDCVMVRVERLEGAAVFYEKIFGMTRLWKDHGSIGLRFPESDAEIVLHTNPEIPSRVDVNYLVGDVEDACSFYVQNACKILVPPFDIPIGKCAVVQDPFGVPMSILDMSKGRRRQQVGP